MQCIETKVFKHVQPDPEESTYKLYHQYFFVSDLKTVDMAQPQHHASVTITNDSRGNLKLVCGDQFAPDTILEGNSIFFVAANPEGYVIYKGTNVQGGPPNCEWLLAWNVPGRGNQVYVDCGAIGTMEAIPADEIYKRVEASKSSSTAVDAKTKTSATAVIEAIADTPALGCDFKVYN